MQRAAKNRQASLFLLGASGDIQIKSGKSDLWVAAKLPAAITDGDVVDPGGIAL